MAPEEGLKPASREEGGLQVVGAETRRESCKDLGFYSMSDSKSLKGSKPDTDRIRPRSPWWQEEKREESRKAEGWSCCWR